MPLAKFVLILLSVIAAAAATVAVAVFVLASFEAPLAGSTLAIPVLLAAWVIWRVISDRLNSREDDHYDRIPPR